MSELSCAIIGLPNVGKSTLFNALTRKRADASNYPFCTIDPNIGVVEVEDHRLEKLAKISRSKKIVPATMTFVDIAGLVKGASQGEGLGNKFLSNIRETDAIIHVVRCFKNEEVVHVEGKIDPLEDIEVINLELALADLQMISNVLQKLEKKAKGNKDLLPTLGTLKKAQNQLNENRPLRLIELTPEEYVHLEEYPFLTLKKVIYATNISEESLDTMSNEDVEKVKQFAQKENSLIIPICAQLEQELATLPERDALEYLQSLGLQETGLDRLIHLSFKLLNLITFITTGEIETKAWTIKKGTSAQDAAGKIHTDIQKGFIRAEVVTYDDMIKYGGRTGAKEAGKARSEGKNYIVQDSDVILFYHN